MNLYDRYIDAGEVKRKIDEVSELLHTMVSTVEALKERGVEVVYEISVEQMFKTK